MAKPSVAIVGCGTVGTALGRLLAKSGYSIIGVSTRHESTARKAAEQTHARRHAANASQITPGAQVVFITTPDDAIEPTCRDIAKNKGFASGAIVIHCSGALSSSVLSSAGPCGAYAASLHPLQSFASAQQAEHLVPGSYCAVEGDPQALPTVRQIVADLGGLILNITVEGKTLYHAAAVVASNYLVALMHVALTLNQSAGLPPEASFKALLPLVEGTLKNIALNGIPKALTGPIARADVATVRAHLEAMKRSTPQLLEAYHALGRLTVGLAKAKGTLPDEPAKRLTDLLADSGASKHDR